MFWHCISEFFQLLGLRCVVSWRNACEFAKVVARFYPNSDFRKWDLALLWSYVGNNPYKISRRYLEAKGVDDPHLYGETPLTTLQFIAEQCGWKPTDNLYELGCGRGRTCLWLRAFVGCRVIGIEIIPEFVRHAQRIKERYGIEGLNFQQADFTQVDYRDATAIYLYGTCLDDKSIKQLVRVFARLRKGAKVVTVSYTLNDYTEKDLFVVVKKFPVRYPWGTADVYLQERT